MRNRVTLIGNLGQDPEIKNLDNGTKMAKFSMATNESYRNSSGERVTDTEWHNIVVFGPLSEVVEKYLKKGSEIALEGKLHSSNYNDKDGNKRYYTDIRATDLVMLGGK